ncbi:transcriptional regulator with XRE-family HTH domain [Catalinimonas alkaloidigena]|uniref:helix-turn-helix domain-containing protein n=1 Tax=Catalinimonas alkaloidigena TaxID=1075417 RepID=UPI002406E360|nr:helix-turn-helix transcriptional regulator [Catalinimonas alkaloidigena]MDF9799879.1 transcriptional regulator with XRE-family HTH domain [Catalinimonas alkaloidigena]
MESKPILSERIRQRRLQKGYSQEFLADSAKVSIRTLQRIEGGQTEPRGHTLIALADALDVAIEDLMDFTKKSDRSVLHLINLSALSYFVLPLGNIILPLIIWILYKDKVEGANQFGKRQVFIQIGWTMLIFFSIILWIFSPYLNNEWGVNINSTFANTLPLTGTFLFYVLDAIYIIIVSILIAKNKKVSFLGLER